MNNTFYSLVRNGIGTLLLFCFVLSLPAQEIVDHAQYRAVYNFSYKTKPDQTGFAKTDLMYLDIGQKVTKFYSRYEQIRDSIVSAGLKSGLSTAEISKTMKGLKKGSNAAYYQYFQLQKTTVVPVYLSFGFIYDEEQQSPKWEIHQDKILIYDYHCTKASANYLGRKWIVYYTSEIPFNQGPWKLWGLPGLIVQAQDSEHIFEFKLDGFELIKTPTPIIFTYTRNNGAEYKKITKQEAVTYEKKFYNDFFSSIRLLTGKEVVRADGLSNPSIRVPYIPLEPW